MIAQNIMKNRNRQKRENSLAQNIQKCQRKTQVKEMPKIKVCSFVCVCVCETADKKQEGVTLLTDRQTDNMKHGRDW